MDNVLASSSTSHQRRPAISPRRKPDSANSQAWPSRSSAIAASSAAPQPRCRCRDPCVSRRPGSPGRPHSAPPVRSIKIGRRRLVSESALVEFIQKLKHQQRQLEPAPHQSVRPGRHRRQTLGRRRPHSRYDNGPRVFRRWSARRERHVSGRPIKARTREHYQLDPRRSPAADVRAPPARRDQTQGRPRLVRRDAGRRADDAVARLQPVADHLRRQQVIDANPVRIVGARAKRPQIRPARDLVCSPPRCLKG